MIFLFRYTVLTLSLFLTNHLHKIAYTIQKDSKVTLDINTNLAKVSCGCLNEANFAPYYTANLRISGERARFSNAFLKLDVNKINCKSRGINNDLQETLNAKNFPQIIIELTHVNSPENILELSPGSSTSIEVETGITIGGKRRPQIIKATVTKIGDRNLRIQSTKTISLSHFDIEPKSSLKFVKINDKATITIDLIVKMMS